jgi:hypothetical protein
MVFHVKLDKAEDGWFAVECPALPGCVSQGKDEAGGPAFDLEFVGALSFVL